MIDEAVAATLAEHAALAAGVRAGAPKAWGAIAAHGVVALRDRLGRAPTDLERSALWDALWRAVHAPVDR